MPKLFVKHPALACVAAALLAMLSVFVLARLPIARVPVVAPPAIKISFLYPGASPAVINQAMIAQLRPELSGLSNLLYWESSIDSAGAGTITVTFQPDTDAEVAQAHLQKRLKKIEKKLPYEVRQYGLRMAAAPSSFLMVVSLASSTSHTQREMDDFLARQVGAELRRLPGVGAVKAFGDDGYGLPSRPAGQVTAEVAILTSPGANLVKTAQAVRMRLDELAQVMPAGMRYTVPFDIAPFARVTPVEVVAAVMKAFALLLALLLLVHRRAHRILAPAIIAPLALLATFASMALAGYAIDELTMLGMVLAIGLIVDDGVVAMDAAQHAGSEQALASAMRNFSRTTCATMLVLSAMFIPMTALASSAVGEIYRQFMAAMVIAMWLTMLLVLAVAPALTRMWPRRAGRPIAASAASLPRRCARMFMLCAGFVAALVWALPSDSLVG
ncbi:hypothetical protein GTP38_15610 [Duganella sp. FT94W]|uniref:MMPL family transporter n=1 Tax=Duganella lactea TaxID=2692173 RepID=A0ABW9V9W3_9BURK|nr:efflux RND transporter permease subunit [Duganella lactea]MYM35761.1 hypothetical protein [Duganella lactea]